MRMCLQFLLHVWFTLPLKPISMTILMVPGTPPLILMLVQKTISYFYLKLKYFSDEYFYSFQPKLKM